MARPTSPEPRPPRPTADQASPRPVYRGAAEVPRGAGAPERGTKVARKWSETVRFGQKSQQNTPELASFRKEADAARSPLSKPATFKRHILAGPSGHPMKTNVSSKSHAAKFFEEAAKNPDTAGQRKPVAAGNDGPSEPKPKDKARRRHF